MEIETTKTLAETDASLSLGPTPPANRSGSGSETVVGARGNGSRVSGGGNGGLNNGDNCVGGDTEGADRGRIVEAESQDADLGRMGILLVVDVPVPRNSVEASGKNSGHGDDEGSMAGNRGDKDEKQMELPDFVSEMGEKGGGTGVEASGHQVKPNGNENSDGEGSEDDGDEEHEYSVGDFVWGKIRSHPWWPGQIYDPSDASEYARKYDSRERLLVAYFGDGSFSWCSSSQLKHFTENFEKMSKQSSSKNFLNAVCEALEEIGRLVESKLTCSCISEDTRIQLARPLAINAGIKQGILVPDCDLDRCSIIQYEPAEVIATLKCIAQVSYTPNMLELTVLKSWMSAFYRAKGCHMLALYHEPLDIEGLEDKSRNWATNVTDICAPVELPMQGPSEEEWVSSPEHHEFDQADQSVLQKCPQISKNKLYHRRKRKSVAQLMKEDKKGDTITDAASPGRLVSTSEKKERKGGKEAVSEGSSDFTSPSERKRGRRNMAEILSSPNFVGNKESHAKDGGNEGEEEIGKKVKLSSFENGDSNPKEESECVSTPRERKKSKYLSPPFTTLKSPSFSLKSPSFRARNSSCKQDSEAEYTKIAEVAQVGERATKASSGLVGSSPPVKCDDETFKAKVSKVADTAVEASANPISQSPKGDQKRITSSSSESPNKDRKKITKLNPQSPKEDKKLMIDWVEISASIKEVVSEVRSAALDPLCLREKFSIDMIAGFTTAFRSAIYLNGSNYKMYQNHRRGRKRKSLNSRPELLESNLNQTDSVSPEYVSQQTSNENDKQEKSGEPRIDQSGVASGIKVNDKGIGGEAYAPVSLLVTFPPGFSLPSKSDLISVFSKFGHVNEMQTDVLPSSSSARVVFVKGPDAEAAFKKSTKRSPFGPAKVDFRLQYPSAAPRVGEGILAASQHSAVDEASSGLVFIKQKLEMMASMLETSNAKTFPEMKSNLEVEMKGLLEKVNSMANASS